MPSCSVSARRARASQEAVSCRRDVDAADPRRAADTDPTDAVPALFLSDTGQPIRTGAEIEPSVELVRDGDRPRGNAVPGLISDDGIVSGAAPRRRSDRHPLPARWR